MQYDMQKIKFENHDYKTSKRSMNIIGETKSGIAESVFSIQSLMLNRLICVH